TAEGAGIALGMGQARAPGGAFETVACRRCGGLGAARSAVLCGALVWSLAAHSVQADMAERDIGSGMLSVVDHGRVGQTVVWSERCAGLGKDVPVGRVWCREAGCGVQF